MKLFLVLGILLLVNVATVEAKGFERKYFAVSSFCKIDENKIKLNISFGIKFPKERYQDKPELILKSLTKDDLVYQVKEFSYVIEKSQSIGDCTKNSDCGTSYKRFFVLMNFNKEIKKVQLFKGTKLISEEAVLSSKSK